MKNRLITLVRHAKSSWKIAGQTDHDRKLNSRGERDAPIMANRLVERQCIPDLILCSSAVRTRQTASVLMDAFGMQDDSLRVERCLYLCPPETLLEKLTSVEDGLEHVMIIGHNPGLEQLSTLMSPLCNPQMPTLGIRHFSCSSFDHMTLGSQPYRPEVNSEVFTEQKIDLIFEDFPKNDQ